MSHINTLSFYQSINLLDNEGSFLRSDSGASAYQSKNLYSALMMYPLSFSASAVSRYHRKNDRSPPRPYRTEIAPQSRPRDGRYIFALKTSLLGAGFHALLILTYLPFLCDPSGFTIYHTTRSPPSMGRLVIHTSLASLSRLAMLVIPSAIRRLADLGSLLDTAVLFPPAPSSI